MLINDKIEIKYFYRFIEFTSRLLGVDLPHERFKLIILDNFKAESKVEKEVKNFADSYLYLINNTNQSLTVDILNKSYYLLTGKMLDEYIQNEILKIFYGHFDEYSYNLACSIHSYILDHVDTRKIEYAFMLSNLIMLKKGRYPFIPYQFIYEPYFRAIESKNQNKLMIILKDIEAIHKDNIINQCLKQEDIINKIKEVKVELKRKYEIKNLYLYGSYAKKKITPSSDVDFLIVFEKDLINLEKNKLIDDVTKFLEGILKNSVDLLDFTHALENLDINEMENIITLI